MPDNVQPDASNDAEAPALNDAVLAHLGRLLATSFTLNHSLDEDSNRLAFVTKRLSAALELAEDRDEKTFRDGLLEATPYLLRFATSLTRNSVEADDLVQETMLRAWRSKRQFTIGTNLNAWLSTIMRNNFYNAFRKNRMEITDSENSISNRASLPEQAGAVDLTDVRKALAKLPDFLREALILVAVECMSYEEAAAVMGCKIGTVKSRVWRARDQLVTLLGFKVDEIGNEPEILAAMKD